MLETLKLAIVDVETTGVSVTGDRIIEIGVVRIEQGRVARVFNRLIDPERRISRFIEELTGIRNKDLEGAPTFRAIHEELEAVLEGCVFVAHNVQFDYGLIRNEFSRLGRIFSSPHLCSVRISRALYPRYRHHGLSELINRFELDGFNRHRALGDADAVWAFLQAAHRDRGPEKFGAAVNALLRAPDPPPQLPAEVLQGLPEGPGVYVVYDADDRALRIGRSRALRATVLALPSATRIEIHPTFGELGARLLESHLIRTLAPVRRATAREPRRVRAWPYPGPIMLEEADADRAQEHVFIVDGWRLVRSFRYDEDGTQPFLPEQAGFDHDAYKILVAHVVRHPRAVKPVDSRTAELVLS